MSVHSGVKEAFRGLRCSLQGRRSVALRRLMAAERIALPQVTFVTRWFDELWQASS